MSNTVTPQQARSLRMRPDANERDLRRFFEARDRMLDWARRAGVRIHDFMELSPMLQRRCWSDR